MLIYVYVFLAGVGHVHRTDERSFVHGNDVDPVGGHHPDQKPQTACALLTVGQHHHVRRTRHRPVVHIHRPATRIVETFIR